MSQQVLFGLSNASARALGQARRHYGSGQTRDQSSVQQDDYMQQNSIQVERPANELPAAGPSNGSLQNIEHGGLADDRAVSLTHDILEQDQSGDFELMESRNHDDLQSLLGPVNEETVTDLQEVKRIVFCIGLSTLHVRGEEIYNILFPDFKVPPCFLPLSSLARVLRLNVRNACLDFQRRHSHNDSAVYMSQLKALRESVSQSAIRASYSPANMTLVAFIADQDSNANNAENHDSEYSDTHDNNLSHFIVISPLQTLSHDWHALLGSKYAGFSGEDCPLPTSDVTAHLQKKNKNSQYSRDQQDIASLPSHSTFTLRKWIHEINTNGSIISD